MPARVKWIEGKTFLGIDVNGKSTVMSSPEGPGVSPDADALLGLGAVLLVDVVIILQKQRQPFAGVETRRAYGSKKPGAACGRIFICTFIVTGGGCGTRRKRAGPSR